MYMYERMDDILVYGCMDVLHPYIHTLNILLVKYMIYMCNSLVQ